RRGVVNVEAHVQVLISAKYFRDVGHDFLIAALARDNKWVRGDRLLRELFSGAHSGGERRARVSPGDRAERGRRGTGAEIGNCEAGLEGPHFAAQVFADQKFHLIPARLQCKTSVILEAFSGFGQFLVELYFNKIANIADGRAGLILDLADEI